jgi:hypothetical protein
MIRIAVLDRHLHRWQILGFSSCRLLPYACCLIFLLPLRQREAKLRALGRVGLDPEPAAVKPHEFPHHLEPESETLAGVGFPP